MVANVLRLRFALLVGALRGGRTQALRMLLGLVILGALVATVCLALASLRDSPVQVAQAVAVLAGAALTIGVAVGPLVGDVPDHFDPRRFIVFGADAAPLSGALALAAFASVPSLGIVVIGVTAAVMWVDHGAPAGLTWTATVIGIITTVLFSRISMALSTVLLAGRRTRELTGLFVLGLIVIVIPVAVFFGSMKWEGAVPSPVETAVQVLAVTPFGAAWAVAGAAAGGQDVAGLLVIAIITLLAAAGLWVLLVERLLHSTDRPAPDRARGGLGWFAVMPATPGGAIAARSLIYWIRDRRYGVNVVIVPIAATLTVLPLLVAGVPLPAAALVPVPLMALFLGWIPHNDVAYDSTAIWLHVVSGVRGVADRLGRLVPIVCISIPVLAVAIPISIALYGRWALLPAMIGVAANLFLAGLGLSSVFSVLAPYPATRPGDGPFQQPQRSGSGVGAQGTALLGAIVLSAPSLWFSWQAVSGDINAADNAFWAGLGMGVAVLIIGVAIGSALFERRGTRMMEFAEAI